MNDSSINTQESSVSPQFQTIEEKLAKVFRVKPFGRIGKSTKTHTPRYYPNIHNPEYIIDIEL